MIQQMPGLAPENGLADLPARLFAASEHLVVLGAFAALLLFAPLSRGRLLAPLVLGGASMITGAAALLMRFDYASAAQAAYYGLGLNLPPPSPRGLFLLAGLFAYSLTIIALLAGNPRERTAGLGLVLVGGSGLLLQLPYQLLLTLFGFMALGRSALPGGDPSEASVLAEVPAVCGGVEGLPAAAGRGLFHAAGARGGRAAQDSGQTGGACAG